MDDLFGVTELVEKKIVGDSRNPSVADAHAQKQPVEKIESV
jgi:hypothetical protein